MSLLFINLFVFLLCCIFCNYDLYQTSQLNSCVYVTCSVSYELLIEAQRYNLSIDPSAELQVAQARINELEGHLLSQKAEVGMEWIFSLECHVLSKLIGFVT